MHLVCILLIAPLCMADAIAAPVCSIVRNKCVMPKAIPDTNMFCMSFVRHHFPKDPSVLKRVRHWNP